MNHTNPDALLSSIGGRLYQLRHGRYEKIENVAKALQVHHSVISKIEHGKYTSLNIAFLSKMCDYYEAELKNIIFP
jgi:transcriptional regulator with XRE-family HTH domain